MLEVKKIWREGNSSSASYKLHVVLFGAYFVKIPWFLMVVGRSPCCDYYMLGSGHTSYGQEECHCAFSALCGDSGLHFSHLLRQDRHTDH